ncbi:MAG: halocyanin domain-containing protein [Salinigranum sp.]
MLGDERIGRRTLLKALAAGTATGVLAGCTGGTSSGGSGGGSGDSSGGGSGDSSGGGSGSSDSRFGGWMADVKNYDGVTDETGSPKVTVTVGAKGNGGPYAFDPPAVKIDAGTKVVWTWSGNGGAHDVTAADGSFQSKLAAQKGHTFEHTFADSGTFKYYCQPHRSLGMKGVVVVV